MKCRRLAISRKWKEWINRVTITLTKNYEFKKGQKEEINS